MPIDYKKYPSNWKTEIRPAVLKRANDCCEECGVKNHSIIHRTGKGKDDWVYWPEGIESEGWSLDGLKSTNIVLTIAHLVHDEDKTKHIELENLKALCQKCHLAIDMKQHVSNRLNNKHKNNLKLF